MNIKDTRRQRLQEWFSSRTLPAKDKSYISQIITGKSSLGEKGAARLEREYGMPPGFLSEPIGDNPGNVTGFAPHNPKGAFPVISWVSAGQWIEAVEPYQYHEIDRWLETTVDCSSRAFWLDVKGDSMTAIAGLSIPEGTVILVDPDVEPRNGKLVVAKIDSENEVTFKKLVIDSGRRFLKPLNPQYPMTEINSNCRIVGVVVDAKIANIP